MQGFADMHMHCLYGVDDGAADEAAMCSIVDASYADGTRVICATPHYHPYYFGDNRKGIATAFQMLSAYAAEKYPDLTLVLGNEMRYSKECTDWLREGSCRTLNGTRYALVDFRGDEPAENIVNGMTRMLSAGYRPVLAHAERYADFHRDMRELLTLRENGVIIQLDSTSLYGGWGGDSMRRSKRILTAGLYDVAASDGHDTSGRPPVLSKGYEYVALKCGQEYADHLYCAMPRSILGIEK